MLTDQQARDLLHLAADTVPIGAASTSAVAMTVAVGRRRRWPVAAAAAAVVLVLGGGVVIRHIASEDAKPGPIVVPLTSEALRNYDPAAMPMLMDEAARAVFSRSFAGLPASQFKASGELDEALPVARYHQANSMEVLYTLPGQRELWLFLGHGRSYAEGDPEQICSGGRQSGTDLSCEVLRFGDETAIVTVRATADGWMGPELGLVPGNRGDVNDRQTVPKADLDVVDPDALFFERTVKVVHSETFVSVVEEAVHVPNLDQAEQAFQVPVIDMVELATDPTMVIPEPDIVSAPNGPTEFESADRGELTPADAQWVLAQITIDDDGTVPARPTIDADADAWSSRIQAMSLAERDCPVAAEFFTRPDVARFYDDYDPGVKRYFIGTCPTESQLERLYQNAIVFNQKAASK